MKRQKKKLRDVNSENNLFDNWEYYNSEMKLLIDNMNVLETRCVLIQGDREKLQAENQRLRDRDKENQQLINQLQEQLQFYKEQEKIKKIPITEIVDYCKNLRSIEEAKPIIDMLYKWLRFIGTDEDYKLVDSISAAFKERETGKMRVVYNNPTIYATGSVHEDNSKQMFIKNNNDNLFEELV